MMPRATTFTPTRCAPGSSRVNPLKNEIPVQSFDSEGVMNRQQVWKIVGVILLVCGLQLYGQQRASGEEDEAKALTYITFNFTGSAADSVYIQYMAINPAGAITGYYV